MPLADIAAVPSLLADFGGMGSFNDVWIDPRNGHHITMEQVRSVNQHFGRLRAEIYELTKSL
jgi:hypothetical protein